MQRMQKVLLGSMAAYLACFGLNTTAEAASLEEAIKGVEVNGFLRYRYTGVRFENLEYNNGVMQDNTKHQFRSNVNFSTPVVDAVKMNLGLVYNNSNTTNTGTTIMQGTGLGASEDGKFGVSTFYATITPSMTKTQIDAGKMRTNSPLNDTLDDRVTGISVMNQDIQGVTLQASFYDTWSLDDGGTGINFMTGNDSVTTPYYLASVGVDIQGIEAQAMFAGVQDIFNSVLYFTAGYNHPNFHVKAEYAMAQLAEEGFNRLMVNPDPTKPLVKDHALMTLEAGVKFSPVSAKVGYIGSGADGYKVSLDEQGGFSMAGQIWNEWSGSNPIQMSYSPLNLYPVDKESLSVIYGSVGLHLLQEDALKIALDYVNGTKENKTTSSKITFQEITPYVTYKYNKNVSLLFYYAMLTAKQDPAPAAATYADAKHDRYRFQVRYDF